MTCTHAALRRRDLVELGFKVSVSLYDYFFILFYKSVLTNLISASFSELKHSQWARGCPLDVQIRVLLDAETSPGTSEISKSRPLYQLNQPMSLDRYYASLDITFFFFFFRSTIMY